MLNHDTSDSFTFSNAREKQLRFRLDSFDAVPEREILDRGNYYNVFFVLRGRGWVSVETTRYVLEPGVLLFVAPGQKLMLNSEGEMFVSRIQFHASFYGTELREDEEEFGCKDVLFNALHGTPVLRMDEAEEAELKQDLEELRVELRNGEFARQGMVMLQLRILLIKASRLKLKQQPQVDYESWRQELPPALRRLSQLVEEHYRRKHRPQDYAKLLNITPNALNKLVKKHLHQTLTQYIRDRILEHAKWQLLHTQRPIKSVAHELGFEDELYFSRTFKRAIGQSPRTFRNKEMGQTSTA
jgi:AraC family transcriptional regulator, transcriptional activator of pobA